MLLPPPVLLLFPPKVERRVLLRPLVDLFVAPVPGLLGLPWLLPKERLLFFFFLVFVVVVVVFLSERESEGVEKADDFFRLLLLFKKTTRAPWVQLREPPAVFIVVVVVVIVVLVPEAAAAAPGEGGRARVARNGGARIGRRHRFVGVVVRSCFLFLFEFRFARGLERALCPGHARGDSER